MSGSFKSSLNSDNSSGYFARKPIRVSARQSVTCFILFVTSAVTEQEGSWPSTTAKIEFVCSISSVKLVLMPE
jgi:hypothetical protein